MSPNNISSSLESIIEGLVKDLERYALRENANQLYINKQNQLIKKLVAIYNSINSIKNLDAWEKIEAEMQRLEQMDRQLTGHFIFLHCRPKGQNFSRIIYNPFPHD